MTWPAVSPPRPRLAIRLYAWPYTLHARLRFSRGCATRLRVNHRPPARQATATVRTQCAWPRQFAGFAAVLVPSNTLIKPVSTRQSSPPR